MNRKKSTSVRKKPGLRVDVEHLLGCKRWTPTTLRDVLETASLVARRSGSSMLRLNYWGRYHSELMSVLKQITDDLSCWQSADGQKFELAFERKVPTSTFQRVRKYALKRNAVSKEAIRNLRDAYSNPGI